MTPKNAPLKLITDFAAPPEKDPIPRSQTTSPSSHITGLNRFFHPAGFPSRSATSTPIGMSALTPVDPFWAQRDPFPPSARAGTPGGAGGKLLTPVTESSPLDRTPIQRIGQELMAPAPPPPPPPPASLADLAPPAAPALVKGAKTQNISSPVEIRNSSGFSESQSVTLGDFNKMERAPTPPQRYTPPPQTSSPVVPKRTRSMSLRSSNKPGGGGLHIQFPPMDQFLRSGTPAAGGEESKGHRRKDSRPSPPKEEDIGGFLDLLEKGQKRLDTQRAIPRTSSQLRRVSPERRRRSPEPERTYPRKMSVEREPRGRTQQVKRSHMRSPSSPLPFSPQAALYREDTAPVEIDSVEIQRPSETPQFNVPRYDEPRDRSTARDFNNNLRSPPSPTLSPEQAFHVHDEFNDERYYTSPRIPSRNRDRNRDQSRDRDRSRGRGRSRVKETQGSHIRSPSSPLPMSPQALLYQEMSAAVDRQHEEEENSRSRRRPNRSQTRDHTRMDSRTRGPQFQQQHQSLRRSRSERTLRQWSEQLENGGHYSLSRADSPAPSTLSRNMSISRGLPSNPRAWRADLQVSSRGNSPVPSRGRSPVNVTRSMTPAHDRTMSPSARNFSPSGQRHLSPAPYRGRSPAPRNTITPAPRERSPAPPLENRAFVPGPIEAPYESVPTPTTRSRYISPQPAPYESIPTPLPSVTMTPAYESPISTHGRNLSPAPRNSSRNTSRARGRSGSRQREPLQQASPRPAVNPYYQSPSISTSEEIPPLPALSRSNSHKRNNSEPAFKPLIRKLPPMPLSPPPLPQDFPVHHALQMHLEPGKKKETGNNPKRTNRPEEMTPPQLDYDDEGWAGQYRNPDEYYEEMNRLQEMRARHSKTPSQGSFGSRGLGTMNMI